MATTVAQVKAIAVEYATLDDEVIQNFIDMAAEYVSRTYWGSSRANLVQALYAAHLMKCLGADGSGAGGGGAIASESLGPLSVSYSEAETGSIDDLSSTAYGAQIKQLMMTRKLQKGIFVSW